jgi:hypothetical protein
MGAPGSMALRRWQLELGNLQPALRLLTQLSHILFRQTGNFGRQVRAGPRLLVAEQNLPIPFSLTTVYPRRLASNTTFGSNAPPFVVACASGTARNVLAITLVGGAAGGDQHSGENHSTHWAGIPVVF